MERIGTVELKAHISHVIDRVCKGEEFVITRRGKPVGRLAPLKKRSRAEVFEDLKRLRAKNPPIPWETLKEWRDEGRP